MCSDKSEAVKLEAFFSKSDCQDVCSSGCTGFFLVLTAGLFEQAKTALEDMLNNDVYLHHNHAEPVTVVASQKSVYSVYRCGFSHTKGLRDLRRAQTRQIVIHTISVQ